MPGTKKRSTYSWSVPVKFDTSAFSTTSCREPGGAGQSGPTDGAAGHRQWWYPLPGVGGRGGGTDDRFMSSVKHSVLATQDRPQKRWSIPPSARCIRWGGGGRRY